MGVCVCVGGGDIRARLSPPWLSVTEMTRTTRTRLHMPYPCSTRAVSVRASMNTQLRIHQEMLVE